MIGYAVAPNPVLASYRLRVELPSKYLGMPYLIGLPGDATFFYKNGKPCVARQLKHVVYDVVNDHFGGSQAHDYYAMCDAAEVITCGSDHMRAAIERYTGRSAVVIDDPYENTERLPACRGQQVLWFGHSANLGSLRPYTDSVGELVICSNGVGIEWTRHSETTCLDRCAAVLMTGSNPGASSNRIVKALRAGRFVIAPTPCESWRQFAPYIWIGDVREGLEWAFHHREEVCNKIRAGQDYVRDRFSPEMIGAQWGNLFASILDAGTSERRAGPPSTRPGTTRDSLPT